MCYSRAINKHKSALIFGTTSIFCLWQIAQYKVPTFTHFCILDPNVTVIIYQRYQQHLMRNRIKFLVKNKNKRSSRVLTRVSDNASAPHWCQRSAEHLLMAYILSCTGMDILIMFFLKCELPVLSSHENQSRWQPESETGGVTKKNNTYDIARLTVSLFLHGKEGLATQLGAAGHADEAVDMEDLVHGSAAGTLTYYVLPAACTAACGDTEDGKLRAHSTHTKGQIT